jgi:hypothetical protein
VPEGTMTGVGEWQRCRAVSDTAMGLIRPHMVDKAHNLRDWPDLPVDAQSVRRPRPLALPAVVPETAAQTIGATDSLRSLRKTIPHGKAASNEARTGVVTTTKELRKGSA